jgi:uncharacterized protein (DUF4415 family)
MKRGVLEAKRLRPPRRHDRRRHRQSRRRRPRRPPIDIDWTNARLVIPPGKDVITLRIDRDVLDWLRAQGKGYQTRINQILRVWHDATLKEKGPAIQKAAEEPPPVKRPMVKRAAVRRAA